MDDDSFFVVIFDAVVVVFDTVVVDGPAVAFAAVLMVSTVAICELSLLGLPLLVKVKNMIFEQNQ